VDKQIADAEADAKKLQAQLDEASNDAEPPKVISAVASKPAVPRKPQTEAEKLEALTKGLNTIHSLRDMFKKDAETPSPMRGAEKFANGAMSEELSNHDSQVWSTIESMLGAAQQAQVAMKGKKKEDREKIMASLEGSLDKKATVLSNVSAGVELKQQHQDEEYLLGLLLLHNNNWSMEKQLNATHTFMKNSPVIKELYAHHDAKKGLAGQLAVMLDAAAKGVPAPAKKPTEKKQATKAAKAMFIQLAATYMNRDCPYCAAQCVDKCHTAGKPYVQCLTDCADAGK
jgi:hypothetical protein